MMMTNSQLMSGTALNLCLDRQGEPRIIKVKSWPLSGQSQNLAFLFSRALLGWVYPFLIKKSYLIWFILNFKAFQSTTKFFGDLFDSKLIDF